MPIHYQQFPKNKALSNLPFIAKQQGSSLILALFVIIILTLLGSALMRMISASSESMSQEVLVTRAYMAANSAMQAELQQLFPLNIVSLTSCHAVFTDEGYDLQTNMNKDISGLYDCTASTSCEKYHTGLDRTNFYRLTSTGECGSGAMEIDRKVIVKSSRTIQVEARSL